MPALMLKTVLVARELRLCPTWGWRLGNLGLSQRLPAQGTQGTHFARRYERWAFSQNNNACQRFVLLAHGSPKQRTRLRGIMLTCQLSYVMCSI